MLRKIGNMEYQSDHMGEDLHDTGTEHAIVECRDMNERVLCDICASGRKI